LPAGALPFSPNPLNKLSIFGDSHVDGGAEGARGAVPRGVVLPGMAGGINGGLLADGARAGNDPFDGPTAGNDTVGLRLLMCGDLPGLPMRCCAEGAADGKEASGSGGPVGKLAVGPRELLPDGCSADGAAGGKEVSGSGGPVGKLIVGLRLLWPDGCSAEGAACGKEVSGSGGPVGKLLVGLPKAP